MFYLHLLNTLLIICRVADSSGRRFIEVVVRPEDGLGFWYVDCPRGTALRVFPFYIVNEVVPTCVLEKGFEF
jgi:hypothetical protein